MNILIKKKSIQVFDERYYPFLREDENGNEVEYYYPSVTHILAKAPTSYGFVNWLKDVGHSAEIIAERAAEAGKVVHNACEFDLLALLNPRNES